MTRKISFGITAILVIVSIVVSSVVTLFFVLRTYDNLLVDLPQRAEQYLKLSEIDELIRSEYFGNIDKNSIDDSLASGYIRGLDDPYSFYVSADDIDEYQKLLSGKMEGVGINAYFDNNVGKMIVSYVHPGSPADKSGVNVNDFIVSVNGDNITAENSSSLLSSVSSSSDKKVSIGIQKADSTDASVTDLNLVSGYEVSSCYFSEDKNIGYIRLSAFYENTYNDFCDAAEYFKNEGISNIILDLRNSSGQNYDSAASIIDYIVPVGTEGTGVIYSAKNSAGETIVQYSSDSNAVNMRFAVLINSRTEAAAELIAADLNDFGKAVLIGEKTAGHGTMQKLFNLSDGGAVYLSVAEIYPYISASFNTVGITPEITVETDEAFKNQLGGNDFSADEQYKTAVAYFSGQ